MVDVLLVDGGKIAIPPEETNVVRSDVRLNAPKRRGASRKSWIQLLGLSLLSLHGGDGEVTIELSPWTHACSFFLSSRVGKGIKPYADAHLLKASSKNWALNVVVMLMVVAPLLGFMVAQRSSRS